MTAMVMPMRFTALIPPPSRVSGKAPATHHRLDTQACRRDRRPAIPPSARRDGNARRPAARFPG